MEKTINLARMQKVVLLYMSQNTHDKNLVKLQESFSGKDPDQKKEVSYELFRQAMQEANMACLDREFNELMKEMDPNETGKVPYQVFLDQVYISKMYLNELVLYNILVEKDTDGKGGVTIAEMKAILADHEEFMFPEQALGATFKQMLNADIDQIDPECIIDT